MKHDFVVAIISFFDNELKQYIVSAENQYKASLIGLQKFHSNDVLQNTENENNKKDLEALKEEIKHQLEPDYPQTYDDLLDHLFDQDMTLSCIKINQK